MQEKLKKVKITVLKVTFNEDLAREYAVEGYPPCLIHKEGQVMYSDGWQKPKEMCDYAWSVMRDFSDRHGADEIYCNCCTFTNLLV